MKCFQAMILLTIVLTNNYHLLAQSGWQTRSVAAGKAAVPVLIYTPASKPAGGYPMLIALHGWNLKAEEWKSSGIQKFADQHGILIVCPQMGKGNYEREYFKETLMRWNAEPSGIWIRESLFKFVQKKYPVSPERSRHGLIGVSTGGHGALLEAGYFPVDFGFAAMISGDFDVSETPEDGLARATFGPIEKFKDRWRAGSAISYIKAYKNVRVFVAHGAKDPVAPVSQARLLEKTFKDAKQKGQGYDFIYLEDPHGLHDWKFWKTQIGPAIDFFAAGFGSDK